MVREGAADTTLAYMAKHRDPLGLTISDGEDSVHGLAHKHDGASAAAIGDRIDVAD